MNDKKQEDKSSDLFPETGGFQQFKKYLSEQASEDPFIRWLLGSRSWLDSKWREMLVVLGVVLVGIYVHNSFKEVRLKAKQADAGELVRAGQAFEELNRLEKKARTPVPTLASTPAAGEMLPPDPASQIKSQTEKMNQILLALSDAKSPYKEIGKIYEALIKTSSSDKQSALKFTDLNLLSENSGSGESLYDEFGWLVVARSKIDDAASYSDGRNLLKLLAEKGQVAHVASAVTLARISETKEERAEAVGVLESLKNRVPEQSPIIDVELEKISS